MSQFLYYRSLSRSSAIWKNGKELQDFPSEEDKGSYLRHMIEGKGFPSMWRSADDEGLEKIALGTLLSKGSFDKVEFLGFDKLCFDKQQINIQQKTDLKFPLKSVGDLHHELCIENNDSLVGSIKLFLECNGNFKRFPKTSRGSELGMLEIIKKYLDEIDEQHRDKAKGWIEKHSK